MRCIICAIAFVVFIMSACEDGGTVKLGDYDSETVNLYQVDGDKSNNNNELDGDEVEAPAEDGDLSENGKESDVEVTADGDASIDGDSVENEVSEQSDSDVEKVRFECSGDICTDLKIGDMWQNQATHQRMILKEAYPYCNNLELGGYDDWRLPERTYLSSLIEGCLAIESCPARGGCTSTSCLDASCSGCGIGKGPTNGCYWPEGFEGDCTSGSGSRFWSLTSTENKYDHAWFVGFGWGDIGYAHEDEQLQVRCIRYKPED